MLKSVVFLSGLIVAANAFWRMECPGRVGLARIDPIVNPGRVANHVHAIHGSSAFSPSSDTPDLRAGKCTSCRVTQDKSAYWHPALYFEDANTRKYELVDQVGGMLAYYLLYGNNITAFPPGFRMLSGSNERRAYTVGDPDQPDPPKSDWGSMRQDDLAQRAIGFNCLNYAKAPEATLYRHQLPSKGYLDANCANGLRFEVMFPSCWKGGNAVDSQNHKDHVAFPNLVMTGDCPAGYPARLPSLLYEVIWNTAAYKNRRGRFVLANGDTTGYGLHGDFMMGWDQDFLQTAVDTCTNPSGRIEDCPIFNVVDEGQAASCQLQGPLPQALLNDNVKGPVARLPGSLDLTHGNGSSDSRKERGPSPVRPVAALKLSPGEGPATPAALPVPGQLFKEKKPAGSVLKASAAAPDNVLASTASAAEPTPPPASTPAPDSQNFYSTQYVTNGRLVSKILWKQQTVYQTVYSETTTTVLPAAASAAARNRRRAAHLHGHGHRKLLH